MGQMELGVDYKAVDDYGRRKALFLKHMKEDWRNPGTHTHLHYPGAPVPEKDGTRCGRCGEPCADYDLIINHDLGWCGCPKDGRGQLSAEQLNVREDAKAFPDCAACGDPWGLHSFHRATLPCETACYQWCGCDGYVPPPRAATPWGTCPGCWGEPHKGPCPEKPGLPKSAPDSKRLVEFGHYDKE